MQDDKRRSLNHIDHDFLRELGIVPEGATRRQIEIDIEVPLVMNYTTIMVTGRDLSEHEFMNRQQRWSNLLAVVGAGVVPGVMKNQRQQWGTQVSQNPAPNPNENLRPLRISPSSRNTTLNNWRNNTLNLAKTSPIEIPVNAQIKLQNKIGYDQISFKWSNGEFKYEARWHTRTPGAPSDQGNTWVVMRIKPGIAGQPKLTYYMTGINEWTTGHDWFAAIKARQLGNSTDVQISLLDRGHWEAP